jgi:uncharacterized protein
MRDLIDRISTDFSLLDRTAVFGLVYTAAGLTGIFYLKNPEGLAAALRGTRLEGCGEFIAHSPANNLPALGWWATIVTIFYFAIPALCIRLLYREKLSRFGLNLRIEPGFAKLFASVTAIMLPLVYLMSLTDSFSAKYPFLQIYDGEPYIGTTF